MRREGRRALTFVVLAVLAVGLVGWSLLAALEGPRAAAARLETLHPGWLAAAVAAWTASLACQAGRWRALMASGRRPGLGTLSLALWGTNAMHLALPGPAAELAAALFVSRRSGVSVGAAVASAVLSRLLALGVLGAGILALWPFMGLDLAGSTGLWLAAAAACLGALGVCAGTVTFAPLAVLRLVGRMAGALGPRLASKVERGLTWWAACFGEVGRLPPRRWLEAVGWSLANIGTLTIASWLGYRATGADIDVLTTLFVHGLLSVATLAMLVLPAGAGALDALCAASLVTLGGVPLESATVCAIALRWIQLLSMGTSVPGMLWMLAQLPEKFADEAHAAVEPGQTPTRARSL